MSKTGMDNKKARREFLDNDAGILKTQYRIFCHKYNIKPND